MSRSGMLVASVIAVGLIGLGMQITKKAITQAGGWPIVIGVISGVVKATLSVPMRNRSGYFSSSEAVNRVAAGVATTYFATSLHEISK